MSARAAARRAAAELPLLVVLTVLLSTAADILPGDSIVSVGEVQLTLARLLILAGLVALVATEGMRGELFRARLEVPLALLVVVALVSSAKWDAWPRYRFLVEGVALFYLAFAVMRARPESRRTVLWAALVAIAVAGLVGVAQVSQDDLTGFYRDGCTPVTKPVGAAPPGSISRAVGTFGNPNVLAGYLLLLLPFGILVAAAAKRRDRLLLVLLVALGYLAVLFTYSRAAALAAIVALAAGVIVGGGARRRELLALAAVGAVLVTFLLASCGSDATADYGRGEEWGDTIDVIRDEPVWGVGPGRLGDVLHERNPRSTARHAHDLWLTWWAEAGTGALIAWVWLTALLLWRTGRAARSGDAMTRAAFVALTGFFAFSVLDHPANVDRVALAFWVVAALAMASTAAVREAPTR